MWIAEGAEGSLGCTAGVGCWGLWVCTAGAGGWVSCKSARGFPEFTSCRYCVAVQLEPGDPVKVQLELGGREVPLETGDHVNVQLELGGGGYHGQIYGFVWLRQKYGRIEALTLTSTDIRYDIVIATWCWWAGLDQVARHAH